MCVCEQQGIIQLGIISEGTGRGSLFSPASKWSVLQKIKIGKNTIQLLNQNVCIQLFKIIIEAFLSYRYDWTIEGKQSGSTFHRTIIRLCMTSLFFSSGWMSAWVAKGTPPPQPTNQCSKSTSCPYGSFGLVLFWKARMWGKVWNDHKMKSPF